MPLRKAWDDMTEEKRNEAGNESPDTTPPNSTKLQESSQSPQNIRYTKIFVVGFPSIKSVKLETWHLKPNAVNQTEVSADSSWETWMPRLIAVGSFEQSVWSYQLYYIFYCFSRILTELIPLHKCQTSRHMVLGTTSIILSPRQSWENLVKTQHVSFGENIPLEWGQSRQNSWYGTY